MNKKEINIAVLGAGSMGRTHAYSISSIPFFYDDLPFKPVLYSVCTRHTESAKSACESLGFLHHTVNEDDIINDPNVDVIDICTPNMCHFNTICKALDAGKNILCEKPLLANDEQILLLEKKLAEGVYKKTYGVVFNNRYLPAIKRARLLVEEGRIGNLISFKASYLHDSLFNTAKARAWRQNIDVSGGGVLLDLGSHIIDLVSYITGKKLHEVFGTSQRIINPFGDKSVDEAYYITARGKENFIGTFDMSKIALGQNDGLKIEIFGDKGSLKFDLMNPNYLMFYDSERVSFPYGGERGYTAIECVQRYDAPSVLPGVKASVGWIRGHVHGMYEYLLSVYEQRPAPATFEDGLYVDRCICASYKSEKNERFERIY